MDIEKIRLPQDLKNESRGMLYAFLLLLMMIIGGVFLTAIGKNGAGLTIALSGFCANAAMFFIAKYSKRHKR